jgi:hypothetical protein
VYRECIAIETWSFRFVYVTLVVLALTFTPHLWGQQQATVRGILTGLSGSVINGATVREARSQAQFNR